MSITQEQAQAFMHAGILRALVSEIFALGKYPDTPSHKVERLESLAMRYALLVDPPKKVGHTEALELELYRGRVAILQAELDETQ